MMKQLGRYVAAIAAVLLVGAPCIAVDRMDASLTFSPIAILWQMGNIVAIGLAVVAVSLLIRFLWEREHRWEGEEK